MKTLINLVLAVGSYFILLYFGIEFAGFWAVLIGLVNYIPYLGGWIGVGLPTLVAIAQFGAFWPVAAFVLSMSAIQPRFRHWRMRLTPISDRRRCWSTARA